MSPARALWARIETIHAVTYFAAESIEAAKSAGLRGFWMGYFGFRAAPLGAVQPGTVEAAFANFAPSMVARSLPDAWTHASPTDLIDARAAGAAAALRAACPQLDGASAPSEQLDDIAANGATLGRPLFTANLRLPQRSDPVERLWQACTTLREQRGDGHVAALAAHQIDGCEAHRLHQAAKGTPEAVLRENRGFTVEAWAAAGARLERRGVLDAGALTDAGHDLVAAIEADTDTLAMEPIDASGVDLDELLARLDPIAAAVVAADVIPFPNPMGLPRP